MVMHHHEPECLLKRLVCCLQGQGHSEGSCNWNMPSYIYIFIYIYISFELLIHLQWNLVWWHIIISWIVLWKGWNALLWSRSRLQGRFRQSFSECSSGWYLLNCWTFCNQTWYVDASALASVMQEDWFAVFKFTVTVRALIIRYDCFYHIDWAKVTKLVSIGLNIFLCSCIFALLLHFIILQCVCMRTCACACTLCVCVCVCMHGGGGGGEF